MERQCYAAKQKRPDAVTLAARQTSEGTSAMGLKLDRPVSSMSDFDLYGLDPTCLGRLDRAMVGAEKKFRGAHRFGKNRRSDQRDVYVFHHTREVLVKSARTRASWRGLAA
jgi:hypothetical protein